MTGNGGGGGGTDDVDNGNTVLTSPSFDLSDICNPYISFYTWFYTGGGSSSFDDSLIVSISNGSDTVAVAKYHSGSAGNSTWVLNELKVDDFVSPGSAMNLIVETSDLAPTGHIVEAGLDLFRVIDSVTSKSPLIIEPSPDVSDVSCAGGSDGSVELSVSGGASPYTYLWSNSSTNEDLSGVSAGTYTLVITDSECNTIQSVFVIKRSHRRSRQRQEN